MRLHVSCPKLLNKSVEPWVIYVKESQGNIFRVVLISFVSSSLAFCSVSVNISVDFCNKRAADDG